MRIKIILVFLIILSSFFKSWGFDQNLEIPEITVPSGSQGYFQINLEDDEHTVAFDGEIAFPDGFSVPALEDTPNRTQYTLNYTRNEKMTFDASYPYKGKDSYPESYYNDVRLLLMTADNSYIKGKTGWVVKLPMIITAEPGVYEATMHTIHLTIKTYDAVANKNDYSEIDLPNITVKINVTEPQEIRYTDNQIFCNDIIINQGEDAELIVSYNSTSDVYEYAAEVILPNGATVEGDIVFSETLNVIENFTNSSSLGESKTTFSISGAYGGRRNSPAPYGVQEIARIKLNTSSLLSGEYEIKIYNEMLSNDDDDYTPAEFVGNLIVKATISQEKCSAPTISIENNQLYVHSDTKGATYHTSIVALDHKDVNHVDDEPIELKGQYIITTYVSAEGYKDSDPTSAMLVWNKADNVLTEVDKIEMDTDRMLILQSNGGHITVCGVSVDETIILYDINGNILYQGSADNFTFAIPYLCSKGHIYIVKVGASAYKYMF